MRRLVMIGMAAVIWLRPVYGVDRLDFDKLLDPLIQSGEIDRNQDEVVLLSSAEGMRDFLSVANKPENFSKVSAGLEPGYCLGITEAQLNLLSSVKFDDPHGVKERDPNKIYQTLTQALHSKFWKPQTIHGYTRAEFIREMEESFLGLPKELSWGHELNPLRRAIEAYQRTHGLKVTNQGEAKLTEGSPQLMGFREQLKAVVETSQKLAEELSKKIMAHIPVSLALVKSDHGNQAHAVTVVGYVKRKGSAMPDRFLVIDPNSPRELKILNKRGDQWKYQSEKIVATMMKPDISEIRDQALSKTFEKYEISLKSNFQSCSRPSDLSQILSAVH